MDHSAKFRLFTSLFSLIPPGEDESHNVDMQNEEEPAGMMIQVKTLDESIKTRS